MRVRSVWLAFVKYHSNANIFGYLSKAVLNIVNPSVMYQYYTK